MTVATLLLIVACGTEPPAAGEPLTTVSTSTNSFTSAPSSSTPSVSEPSDGISVEGAEETGQSDPDLVFDTVNGEERGFSSIDVVVDEILDVMLNGFESNTPVHITFHSDEIDLGTVTADANGRIETSIQIPNTTPGVHRIQFAGTAAGGVQLVKQIKVKIPGDPVPGEPYGVYLCCFLAGTAEDAVIEFVDVTFGGSTFTLVPDIEGGIFFEIPLPDASVDFTIEAVSQPTGERITEQVTVGGGTSQTWGPQLVGPTGERHHQSTQDDHLG